MVIRRLHLYTGLFLWPWAMLYGITGFLFNHPEAFPDRPIIALTQEHIAGTELEDLPSPRRLAGEVVEALREAQRDSPTSPKLGKTDPATYKLLEEPAPKYQRSTISIRATGQDTRHSVFLRLTSGTGRIRQEKPSVTKTDAKKGAKKTESGQTHKPAGRKKEQRKSIPPGSPEAGDSFEIGGGLQTKTPLVNRITEGLKASLRKLDIPAEEVTITRGTNLIFRMEADGKVWTASYDFQRGSVRSIPEEASSSNLSTRRFLTRLHLAHGYPEDVQARWFWAIGVDVMSFVLVFWGLSGLIMWWQLKSQRKLGAAILLVSTITMTCLVLGMHEALTR